MLQRITLLFFVLLLAASPLRVVAQQLQPAPAEASPAAVPLAAPAVMPDTAAALHRLFAKRRHRGHTGLKVGGAALVVSSIIVISTAHGSGYQQLGIYLSGLLGIAGSVPVLATSIVRSVNYSKKREQHIVQTWQQHRLSRHLKRALDNDSLLTAQVRLAQAAALAALSPATAMPAALDTAAALHRLFTEKRRTAAIMLPITIALGIGFGQIVGRQEYLSVLQPVVIGSAALSMVGELVILGKYSKTNEDLAIQALKEHRLSAAHRQELQAEHFRPTKAIP